ncbi:MAG: HAMP domain-containing sensor histidine kinase [Casimicrobiaceae bacterium]
MDEQLDRAPCGLLTFADDGRIVAVNATLREWLGYEPGELVGERIDTLLSMAGRIFHQTHFFPLLRVQGNAEEIYLVLRTRGGLELPLVTNAVRRQRDGQMVNDCALLPLRQRRRHEAEILKAQRAAETASRSKDKFLSMMSHDLRTPLQAIMATAAVLDRGARGSLTAMQQQDVKRIDRASRELLRLLTDILEFARLDSGQVELRVEDMPLTAAIDRAEALMSLQMQEAGLRYQREESCVTRANVRADPDRLQQVLLNLLSNALKFTPAGGSVRVGCEAADARVLVHVRDSGPGIQAEQLERIFQPFVQIRPDDVPAAKRGVGLGLAISRELARAMGGDLTAASRPGEGSTFTIALAASAR